jgi:hypothetical protein
MKNKIKIYILILICNLSFIGCTNIGDMFKGTGPLTTEERTLAPFTRIELKSDVDVIYHYDTIRRVKVTAGQNLIEKISTNVENGNLLIKNKNKYNWVRSYHPEIKVEIWLPDLTYIEAFDATGDINFVDTLKVEEFTLESFGSFGNYTLLLDTKRAYLKLNNGPANLNAKGKSENTYLYNAGFGINDTRELRSNYVYIRSISTNSSYVYSINALDASIEATGNIYYLGNPTDVILTKKGSGEIIKL